MLVSEQKPMEEILSFLAGEDKVFLLGCDGCAQDSGTGGPLQVQEMKGGTGDEGVGKEIHGIADMPHHSGTCVLHSFSDRNRGFIQSLQAGEGLGIHSKDQ